MRDDPINMLRAEFQAWGVTFTHHMRGGGHVQLHWRVSVDKEPRTYIIAKTASDHRGWLNARADIRRFFKADGLTLKLPERKPQALEKALALPKVQDSLPEQVQQLRGEIADLTDLLLEIAGTVGLIREHVLAEPLAPLVKEPGKPSVRSIKALDHVSTNWCSTEALARDMGLPMEVAYRKLTYLKRLNPPLVELSQGKWRKVVVRPHVVSG